MENFDSSWDLEHDWETAQDYVQRMADKALSYYMMPIGMTSVEARLHVVVSIEPTVQSSP